MPTSLGRFGHVHLRGSWLMRGACLWLLLAVTGNVAQAQSEWNPFREQDERAAAQRARRPADTPQPLPLLERDGAVPRPLGRDASGPTLLDFNNNPPTRGVVEKFDLAPLESAPARPPADGTADLTQPERTLPDRAMPLLRPPGRALATQRSLPTDLWRGVDMKQLETLIAPLDVPPKSAALHQLWVQILTSDATPPAGSRGPNHYLALQLEALYRSGLVEAMRDRLANAAATGAADDPLLTAFTIRRDLAAAQTEAACAGTKQLASKRAALPKLLRGEVHVLSGYCSAVAGNAAAAGLAAELAREEEVDAPLAIQVLDAIAAGSNAPKPKLQLPKRLMVLDYRLLEQLGPVDPVAALSNAEPALLYALSQTEGTNPKLAVAAAEAGAALNALTPENLGEVYLRTAVPTTATSDPLFRRLQLYQTILAETAPVRRLQTMRQLIDDGRKSGLGLVLARMLGKSLADIQPDPDLGPLAATAAEIAIAAGDYGRARQFAALNAQAAAWAPLAEIGDANLRGVSESALGILDDQVKRNRFAPEAMHRLAIVLDALDTNVPIPLWEATSRTPQPNTGHLPETGILPQLQDAARKQELGRTMLLVMRTIGPAGPDAAHLIALGDSLRALRRSGLEADARLLAMEALFAAWPRG